MGVADEKIRPAGQEVGGLCPWKIQAQNFQYGGKRGTVAHRSPNGPGGVPRGRSAVELQLPIEKETLAD